MIIRDQWNNTIVNVKDDFIIYSEKFVEDKYECYNIMLKTKIQKQPIYLGRYYDEEASERVIIQLFESYNNNLPYVMGD